MVHCIRTARHDCSSNYTKDICANLFDSFDFLCFFFIFQECICDDSLFTDMNINVHFVRCFQRSFPLPLRLSCRLAFLFGSPTSFSLTRCCSHIPRVFTATAVVKSLAPPRYIDCWPWCCVPLDLQLISDLCNHSVNALSCHNVMVGNGNWIRVSRLQSFTLMHLGYVSNKICNVFTEEQCNHQDGCRNVKKTARETFWRLLSPRIRPHILLNRLYLI